MVAVPFEPIAVENAPSRPPIRLGRPTRWQIEQDIRTAYHEAGHAVLMHALGIGYKTVTIVPNYEDGTAGTSIHGGEFGEQDNDVAALRYAAEDAFLLRHAIGRYAGAEAVRRRWPRRKDWQAGAELLARDHASSGTDHQS